MASDRGGGVSVLAAMTGAVVEQAAKASGPKPTLTSLATEKPGLSILTAAPTPIPNHPVVGSLPDDPDIVLSRLASAKREVLSILESIERLEQAWGRPEEVLAGAAVIDQKLLEREADRRVEDAAKAEAGDKRAAKRVATEEPIEQVVAAVAAKRQTKADMVTALMTEGGGGEDLATRMARLKAEAQAAVFTQPEPEPLPVLDGWTCPTHGKAVTKISARRGREYQACPVDGCAEFERL